MESDKNAIREEDNKDLTPWQNLPFPTAEYLNTHTGFWEVCKIVGFCSDSGLKSTINYWVIINKFGKIKHIIKHDNVRFSKHSDQAQ
jgi:hypothetical protein